MKFEINLAGKEIVVEDKKLAEQANGNILVKCSGTMLMASCVMSKYGQEDRDFFPLTVEYEEKYYAAGKIKGSRFIKRESRPSDEAIINARIIDRAIRPRFDQEMPREIQVVATVLSWDSENDPDVLGLLASSIALSISDIPWNGPIAGVRVIKKENEFLVNPTYAERENSELDVVFVGVEKDNDLLINMIEGGANEASESDILKALDLAKKHIQELIDFQKKIAKEIGKEKTEVLKKELPPDFEKDVKEFLSDKLEKAVFTKNKSDLSLLKQDLFAFVREKYPNEEKKSNSILESEIDKIVHENALKNDKRPDGRKMDEIRALGAEVGLLPRTHGSGLFTRGQTRTLSILTLGAPGDQQLLEGMEITGKKRFMHHYNFPPYSTGEIKPMRGPGRREIGHGMLAEKALSRLIPGFEKFPYTIRVVSEVLSSNGSSSMASVTSSSLAMMDAGVPIIRPATGIAMGLMQSEDGKDYKILTDIQGPEDHYGDMDFKIAGTRKGITAIQMDVKINGINGKIIKETLERAKKAREDILDVVENAIKEPRKELSQYAPKIIIFSINPERIGEVIGPGGKIINEIIRLTNTTIDIEDNGMIFITSDTTENVNRALGMIKDITREAKVGEVFEGKVKRILDFGAFVEIWQGQEGMIHISKMGRRVEKIGDILKVNDTVVVKVIAVDEMGRVNLSLIEKK